MTNCTSCGAPLPPNKIICAYCGTRNSVDLTGLGGHTTVPSANPRPCPACHTAMESIDIGHGKTDHFFIEKCKDCHGLFFDPGELEALLEQKTAHNNRVNHQRIKELIRLRPQTKISYRPCPVCKKMMNRTNFGTKSGVVIDQCREHGIFLDGGELRRLLEWQKAGGHFLHERAEREREKEKQKKEVAKQKKNHAPQELLRQPDSVFGHREYDAVDLITSIVSRLFR